MLHQVYEWRTPHTFTPAYYFEVLRNEGRAGKDAILLESDSSSQPISGNRYSYIALDTQVDHTTQVASLGDLEELLSKPKKPLDFREGIVSATAPPLSHGGAIGYVGYDVKNEFVRSRDGLLQTTATNDQELPNLYMIFPRTILAFDHDEKKVYVTTFCDDGARMEGVQRILEERVLRPTRETRRKSHLSVSLEDIEAVSNMSQEQYFEMVERAKEHILAGNSYQLKVSQRLTLAMIDDTWNIYKRLRSINPSPFSAYLALEGIDLVSCSPEELLRVTNMPSGRKQILTRPIGGTYPRSRWRLWDWFVKRRFKRDSKEKAEHAMLVDLLRNDIGRVSAVGRRCEEKDGWKSLGSVEWSCPPTLETYSHLHHLVTTVQGELADGFNSFDAFRSLFPGGTITGCPKIRAMQLIDELEPTARGPYTGSIGFVTFRDEAQWNIIIRTLLHNRKTRDAYLQVGGGIVHDSDKEREWQETLWKAQALLKAV